jgi:hypothetical protein
MNVLFPQDGGCVVDLQGVEGSAPVVDSCAKVMDKVQEARATYSRTQRYEDLWIELTVVADADEELPRRPVFMNAGLVACVTYMSDDMIYKYENEIS